MKRLLIALAAVAVIVFAMAGGVNAAGSTTATVSATGTVTNVCAFGGSPALAFGSMDAVANSGGATASVTAPTLYCTQGYAATVTDDGGQYGSTGGTPLTGTAWNLKCSTAGTCGTSTIAYTLTYISSLTGAGFSTDIGGSGAGKLSLGATIASGGLAAAPAGDYGDSVVLTIAY